MADGGDNGPRFETITRRTRHKRHVTVVQEAGVLMVLRLLGRPMTAPPRLAQPPGPCEGIIFLPTNQVLEVYTDPQGRSVGYLFTNLDAWLTHDSSVAA